MTARGERPDDRDEGPRARPDVVLCAGGPMLVFGDLVVEDAEGRQHRTHRPVSAVCRCGKSASAPWCDGTHKALPAKLRP